MPVRCPHCHENVDSYLWRHVLVKHESTLAGQPAYKPLPYIEAYCPKCRQTVSLTLVTPEIRAKVAPELRDKTGSTANRPE